MGWGDAGGWMGGRCCCHRFFLPFFFILYIYIYFFLIHYIYFLFSEFLPPPDYWFWYSVKAFSPEIYRCRPVFSLSLSLFLWCTRARKHTTHIHSRLHVHMYSHIRTRTCSHTRIHTDTHKILQSDRLLSSNLVYALRRHARFIAYNLYIT